MNATNDALGLRTGIVLAVDAATVDLRFAGEWKPAGRDVTPNILTYLYHNQRLGFLFAAASLFGGALWNSRRLVGA